MTHPLLKLKTWMLISVAVGSQFVIGVNKAVAGPYADELTQCMLNSTTEADQNLMVRWITLNYSQHPSLQHMSQLSEREKQSIHSDFAQMVERLMSQSCTSETREAMLYEGYTALAESILGMSVGANQEFLSDPDVASSIVAFIDYLDFAK